MRKSGIYNEARFGSLPLLTLLVLLSGALPARAGFINRLLYFGIPGGAVSNLTMSPKFPDQFDALETLTNSFLGSTNLGTSYGSYLRGWIEAPQTGNYTFWIAS